MKVRQRLAPDLLLPRPRPHPCPCCPCTCRLLRWLWLPLLLLLLLWLLYLLRRRLLLLRLRNHQLLLLLACLVRRLLLCSIHNQACIPNATRPNIKPRRPLCSRQPGCGTVLRCRGAHGRLSWSLERGCRGGTPWCRCAVSHMLLVLQLVQPLLRRRWLRGSHVDGWRTWRDHSLAQRCSALRPWCLLWALLGQAGPSCCCCTCCCGPHQSMRSCQMPRLMHGRLRLLIPLRPRFSTFQSCLLCAHAFQIACQCQQVTQTG